MIDKLLRGFSRLMLHGTRFALVPLELLSARTYMRIYLAVLRAYGVNFTGTPRYIASDVKFDDMRAISIGERSVISKRVILLTHDYSITTGLLANGKAPERDVALHREIRIGANVFIGMGVMLLPGTRIDDNVIVGAGSVVRGHISGDSIVTGNPGTAIGSLTERADYWVRASTGEHATTDSR